MMLFKTLLRYIIVVFIHASLNLLILYLLSIINQVHLFSACTLVVFYNQTDINRNAFGYLKLPGESRQYKAIIEI